MAPLGATHNHSLYAAWPDAANPRRAITEDELNAEFGDEQRTVPEPTHNVTDPVDKKTRAKAIPANASSRKTC